VSAELRELATEVAVTAGRHVREARRGGVGGVGTKSTATDMVTEHDRATEALIVELLRRERPGDAILGEEGTDDEGTTGISWLIDPIDGTTNFLYGLPGYAVSVAAVDEHGSLAGAVHIPSADEVFSAHRGGGATLDGQPIRCSDMSDLSTALVGTGFGYDRERRRRQAVRVARLIAEVRDVRRFGAAAADLCYVACGRLDVYYEEFLNPWDLAAGVLIATEAGCCASDFAGGPARPEEVLVTGPALFEPMLSLLARTGDTSIHP
jgi:myo-inositol-1(or 4)-monophosphatase